MTAAVSAGDRLGAGDVVLWRYTRPGHPSESVRPMRVVRDDDETFVAWLAAGTPVLRPVLADGRDLRAVPLTERFDLALHGRANRLDTWHWHGILKIAPARMPWSVWLFWGNDGFRGWYVNLEEPLRRDVGVDRWTEVCSVDHVLDVMVSPDRTSQRKDEDELEAAVAAGRFTAAAALAIEADAEAVEDVVRRWGAPFCDGWEDWSPDPSWPVPQLPPAVASLATYR